MFNSENLHKVKEELASLRSAELAESERRKNEIYEKSPEIAKIDAALRLTGPQIFRITCAGENVGEEVNKLRKSSETLRSDRTEILLAMGYPPDYTDIKYTCTKCSDTGYTENGMCECMRKRLVKASFETSGLGYLAKKQSFDNFDISYYGNNIEYMRTLLNKLKEFADTFSRDSDSLLLVGGTGLGKTHLATSVAKVVMENGHEVFYESVPNVISDFEYEKFKGGAAGEKTSRYFSAELLILDDLGTETITQFSVSCIYNVVNTRINRHLPTIISTNFDSDSLYEAYDSRLVSRLIGEYTSYSFVGTDIRMIKSSTLK